MAVAPTTPEQDTLFATEKIEFAHTVIPLDKLPKVFIGREPSEAFVDSVKRLGVMTPIIVTETPSGTIQVAAGRRRVMAARKAGLKTIPARKVVTTGGWADQQEVITVAENRFRDENPASEVAAVRDLVQRGHSVETIQRDFGMGDRQFAAIKDLLALDPAIFTGFTQGTVKVGVARRISKLPRAQQAQLALRLAESNRLKHRDVDIAIQPTLAVAQDLPGMPVQQPSGAVGLPDQILYVVPYIDLLRAAHDRAASETLRFVLDRAIKMAEQDHAGGEVAMPLGDPETDQALQRLDGELLPDGENGDQLVTATAEPAQV